jgi:hypothetical protein
MALIFAKICFIILLITCAIKTKRSKNRQYDLAFFMLVVDILVLIGLVVFELGVKYIAVFFAMIFIANYINFLGFNILVRNLNTPEGKELKNRTNPFFITMNLLYIIVACLSFTVTFGPVCKKQKLYPMILSFVELLLVINAVYHIFMHYKKYYLRWEANERVAECLGNETAMGYEPLELAKPVFMAQMDSYVCF